MSLTPYEQCISFYRRWASDYHMTPAEIDDTDLEILLDMEILDSRIDAAFANKKAGKKNQVFIDQIL